MVAIPSSTALDHGSAGVQEPRNGARDPTGVLERAEVAVVLDHFQARSGDLFGGDGERVRLESRQPAPEQAELVAFWVGEDVP